MALLGPNGAGKSTLIRLLSGAATAEAGTIHIAGHPLASRRDRQAIQRELGLMPQSLAMFPRYRCIDFLRYAAWLKEVPTAHIEESVSRALKTVDMLESADTQIRHLSGGMRQRLGLAQAVVNWPSVLILDEPTAGLDPLQRVEFRRFLARLQPDTLIVMATHLVEDVAAVAAHVVIIAEGVVQFSGSVQELAAVGGSDTVDGQGLEAAYVNILRS